MRASNLELPNASELWEILAQESPRCAVHEDWLRNNNILFVPFHLLAAQAGHPAEWPQTYPNLSLETLVDHIDQTITACDNYIQRHIDQDYSAIFNALCIELSPQKADAIFVFGAPNNTRIQKGIELFNNGYAPQVIVSGRGPHYRASEQSEAERMRHVALASHVPAMAIMVEPLAITIPDNVKRTLDRLEVMNQRPQRLIIVASSFVLARATMEWYKFTPWQLEIIPVAAQAVDPRLNSKMWHTYLSGRKIILNEYAKMVLEHKMDLLRKENYDI